MAYTLQTGRTEFKGGKNILASEHLQFLEVGATLDAASFGAKTIELGTLIARNEVSGKFERYTDGEEGTLPAGYTDFGILNIDVECNGTDDIIAGEVIVRGSVYEAKLPVAPSNAFKQAVPMIRFINEY